MAVVEYDQQKDYWEGMGKRRSPDHPVVEAFARPKRDFIVEALGGAARPTMLEVGAGNGFFSHTFRSSFDLTCLDFSRNMLEMHPLPWDRKVVGDAESLPFEDDHFDVVFCGNLLHHLSQPVTAVQEMKRVARRNVVLIEPNSVNPLMFLFGLVKKEERGTLKFTPRYLKVLGREAGLRLRSFSTQGTVVPNKTPSAVLPLLRAIDRPSLLGFYHVAVFDVQSN